MVDQHMRHAQFLDIVGGTGKSDLARMVKAVAEAGGEVSHLNLNDETVEGMRFAELGAMSVQYHPEASPGPQDSYYLFERFVHATYSSPYLSRR